MRRLLLLLLVAVPTARAQFELQVLDGANPRPAPSLYSFGSIYTGESAIATFRIRNASAAAATLTRISVAGVGFKLASPPIVPPVEIPAGASVDFGVSFSAPDTGSYSAALTLDGVSILLAATVLPRLTWLVDNIPLTGPIDFGSVLRGANTDRRFTVINQTPQPLTIPAIAIQSTAPDFTLASASPSGFTLQPTESAQFTIRFTPQAAGPRQATLTLGDRAYPLTGFGADPPLPKPLVTIDLKQPGSDRQGILVIRFDAPARVAGTGTATIDFAGPQDLTIAFAAGGRSVTFKIVPGDTGVDLPFQSGTTAGTLTFTVDLGGLTNRQSIQIPTLAAAITSILAQRSPGALDIRITGYDNTRTLAQLAFTFYDTAGAAIGTAPLRADVSADFDRYFSTSDLGGAFQVRAVFPVTGDVSQIASFEVTLTDMIGATRSARTSF